MECVARAGKRYVLHGRSPDRVARFGYGDLVLMSSPGQYAWVDMDSGERRVPTAADLDDAIRLGDALPNLDIVGAMAMPTEFPAAYRDVGAHGGVGPRDDEADAGVGRQRPHGPLRAGNLPRDRRRRGGLARAADGRGIPRARSAPCSFRATGWIF